MARASRCAAAVRPASPGSTLTWPWGQVGGTDALTGQQSAHVGRDAHRPDPEAARVVPGIAAHLAKRFFITGRYAAADHRCRRGCTCEAMGS